MTEEQIQENYGIFIDYIKKYITDDGKEKLITWLDNSDFKYAPASSKYHMAFRGGLVQHSLNVFNQVINLVNMLYGSVEESPFEMRSLAVVSLLHDISKANLYREYYKNVKNEEDGTWEKVKSYTINDDSFLYATQEENSIYMIESFIKLSYQEKLAIRYHSGAFSAKCDADIARVSKAYSSSNLALILHIAEMISTYHDEVNWVE